MTPCLMQFAAQPPMQIVPRTLPLPAHAEHLDTVAVQHAAALAPVIAGLQEETTVLRRELDQQRVQAAVTQQELDNMVSRLHEVWQCMRWGTGHLAAAAAAQQHPQQQDLALCVLQQALVEAGSSRLSQHVLHPAEHNGTQQPRASWRCSGGSVCT
jgi:hypothetical protein